MTYDEIAKQIEQLHYRDKFKTQKNEKLRLPQVSQIQSLFSTLQKDSRS